MKQYWEFKQFVNEFGRRKFKEWIDKQPVSVKAAIHVTMEYIETRKQLGLPFAGKLKGYDEIWELRAEADNVQYRPLFCFGEDNELVLLIGATKTGDKRKTKFNPSNAPKSAEERRKLVLSNRRYVCEYKRTEKRTNNRTQQ